MNDATATVTYNPATTTKKQKLRKFFAELKLDFIIITGRLEHALGLTKGYDNAKDLIKDLNS